MEHRISTCYTELYPKPGLTSCDGWQMGVPSTQRKYSVVPSVRLGFHKVKSHACSSAYLLMGGDVRMGRCTYRK